MSEGRAETFSARAVFWMIAVGGLAFAGFVLFMIFGEAIRPTAAPGASAYSISAVGHKAFVEVLRRLGTPVVVSRHDSARKAGHSAVLVLAEPPAKGANAAALDEMGVAENVLLVLPKWRSKPDQDRRGWIASAEQLPVIQPLAVLQRVAPKGKMVRLERASRWRTGSLEAAPTLSSPQLMEAPSLRPIVATNEGMLVGEHREGGRRIWVLSDPDILSNHGLGRGDNAVLALGLIDELRPEGGAVVFDETIHGFQRTPSFWRVLFEFPYAISTLMAAFAVLVLLWSATGRFGSPVEASRPLERGKAGLIANTADLLQFGGHDREILRRYLKTVMRHVERRLHAPRNLDEGAKAAWLDRLGGSRGIETDFRQLRHRIQALQGASRVGDGALLRAAEQLHRWKQEMLHGPGGHKDK